MEIDYKKAFHETMTNHKQISELNKHVAEHMQLIKKLQKSSINRIMPDNKKLEKKIKILSHRKKNTYYLESKFDILISNSSSLVWEINNKNKIIYCSPQLLETFDYTSDNVLGNDISNYLVNESNQLINIFFNRANASNKHDILRLTFLANNNKKIILDSSIYPLYKKNKKIYSYIAVCKIVKNEQFSEELLFEDVSRLKTLFYGISAPIVIYDLYGKIIEINDEVTTTYQYSREELLNMNVLQLVEESDRENVNNRIEEIIRKNSFLFRTKHIRKNGEIFSLEVNSKIFLLNGKHYIISIIRDISEKLMLQEITKLEELRLKCNIRISNYHSIDLDDLFDFSLDQILILTNSQLGCIFKVNNENSFSILSVYCKDTNFDLDIKDTLIDHSRCKAIYDETKLSDLVIINDLRNEKKTMHIPQIDVELQRMMIVPIISDCKVVAVVVVANKIKEYRDIDLKQFDLLAKYIWQVAEKKETRLKILKYQKLLDLFIEVAPFAIHIYELNEKGELIVIDSNSEASKITKLDKVDIINKSLEAVIPEICNTDYIKMVTDIAKNGGFNHIESIKYDYRNNVGFVEIYVFQLELNKVGVYFKDITQKIISEKALTDSEQKYRTLVENFDDLIMRFNNQLKCVYVNSIVKKYFNIPAEEIIGKTNKEISFFSSIADFYDEKIINVFKNKTPIFTNFQIVKNNKRHIFDLRIFPEFNNDGSVTKVVSITRDITKLKKTEEKLIHEKEKAEKANKFKSEFVASLSHELRTPLNAIIGFCQLINSYDFKKEELLEYIDLIKTSGDRQLQLINDILDLTSMEVGKISIKKKLFNIRKFIRGIEDTILPSINKKGLSFKVSIKKDVPKNIFTDAPKLQQVLINLLDNARKYTEKGKISLKIRKSSNGKRERIVFIVKDTGIGIADSKKEVIFKKFYQVNNVIQKSSNGIGLGLHIANSITTCLGGRISLKSQLNVGSTFKLAIDCLEETKKPSFVSGYIKRNTLKEIDLNVFKDKSILLVEDEINNINILKILFCKVGSKLFTANNGLQAIDFLQNMLPDVIIMDIQLPYMDGLEATKIIKNNLSTSNIPVIALSALVMKEDKEKMFEAGCNDFIPKPYDFKTILTTIYKYLN